MNCHCLEAIPDPDLYSGIEFKISSRLPSNIIYSCFSHQLPLQLPAVGPIGEYFLMAQPIYFSPVFGDGRVLPSGFKVRMIANPMMGEQACPAF